MNRFGQFNFVWIFAILAGGTILMLAIWGAVQTGDTLKYKSDTQAAKMISIMMDPLSAGFSDGSFGKILFRQETRIDNICLADGSFGKNELSISSRSGVGEEWTLVGGGASVHNKYIFSKETLIGEDYYVWSVPFEFPYKVNDLIFLMSGDYCFVNAPEGIEEDVSSLNIENIHFENCSDSYEKVCFTAGSDCDVIVYGSCSGGGCESQYDYGVVSKGGEELRYVGNLIWGAIFSERAVYDCNVERLMYRVSSIAEILQGKASLMDARGCGTNLRGDLVVWQEMCENATSSNLASLSNYADNLDSRNSREVCGLW